MVTWWEMDRLRLLGLGCQTYQGCYTKMRIVKHIVRCKVLWKFLIIILSFIHSGNILKCRVVGVDVEQI